MTTYRWPTHAPGTDVVFYMRWRGTMDTADLVARSLTSGEERRLTDGTAAQYASSGHVVFSRDTELWAAPFDPDSLSLTGEPTRLAEDLLTFTRGGAANFAVTADGSLVYVSTSTGISGDDQLMLVNREGGDLRTLGNEGFQNARHMQLSPSGDQIVLASGPSERGEIWIAPLDGRPPTPLIQEGNNARPVWTHDGSRVVFTTDPPGSTRDLVWLASDGSMREPELLLSSDEWFEAASWVAQRDELVYQHMFLGTAGATDLWRLGPDGEQTPLVQSPGRDINAQVSPDGRLLAYESTVNDRQEIWVREYPDGPETRVSNGGGLSPQWSQDGRELYFMQVGGANLERILAARVEPGPEPRLSPPEVRFEANLVSFNPHPFVALPDGGFVIIRSGAHNESSLGDHLTAVVGLGDELRRIAPPE